VFPAAADGDWLATGPEIRRWRTAIVQLSDQVRRTDRQRPARHHAGIARLQPRRVRVRSATPPERRLPTVTVVSVYAAWERFVDG
jgi:hypothetical protein